MVNRDACVDEACVCRWLRNGLDTRTQDALMALNKSIALTVMGMDGGRNTFLLEGVRNPDAVVMSRIRIATGQQRR